MDINEQKKFMETALIDSFVDEYDAYQKTIKYINSDLNKSNIDFQYSYDKFCVDFLNQTLKNLNNIDIFEFDEFDKFYINFWRFNLYNLQSMLNKKITELGYKYEDFSNKSIIINKLENNKED